MTPDYLRLEARMVRVETEIKNFKEAAEIDRDNQKDWRQAASEQRDRIETAINDHVTDSAKVPGYSANGGVWVISKRSIGWTIMLLVALTAAIAGVLEFVVPIMLD